MIATTSRCIECGAGLGSGAGLALCPRCALREALAPPEDDAQAPDSAGDFELIEEIARGGMGVVFRARQRSLGRVVALKMLLGGALAGEAGRKRLQAEAEAAAKLQHPGIVAIHGVGEMDGQPFFTMDFVEGKTLAQRLDDFRFRSGDAARPARLIARIAEAVHYAHTQGVLHRDLKPSNVLIAADDEPRVTDFGIARRMDGDGGLTLTGQAMGSPSYMPPEQALGRTADARSDVYSLGAILYELLAGRPPFEGDTVAAVIEQVRTLDAIPPRRLNAGVPADLDTVCLKCLEKEPSRRYASALELADDLHRFARGEPVRARPLGVAGRAWRWARRRPAVAALAAGLALAVALGFAGVSWQWRRAEQNTTQAEALVSRLERQRAEDALSVEDTSTALAFLAHQARSHPDDAATAERLMWVLERHNFPLPLVPAFRHGDGINHAEFSRDGEFVVTASRDRTARVWNARTGQPVTPPLRHDDDVAVARFSPDGSKVVTSCADIKDTAISSVLGGEDFSARIWDARTGELLHTLRHAAAVPAAEFSPDGLRVVTGSSDRTARVWDAVTGQPVTEPLRDTGAVSLALFSPDGRQVLTAGYSRKLQLWDAATGEAAVPVMKHPGLVMAAAFSPDGMRIVTAGYDFKVRIWDAATGEPAGEPLAHTDVATGVSFSGDGSQVVSVSRDRTARLWDAATGQPVGQSFEHATWVSAVRFSPDSRSLLTVSEDNSVHLRNIASGKRLMEPIRHSRVIKSAQFSPDGQRLLTASADHTAQIWDIRPGKSASVALRHRGSVQLAHFSADGGRLATASADGVARIWNAHDGTALGPPLVHGKSMTALQFSRDGRRLLAASRAGVRVWDTQTGKALLPLLGPGGVVSDAMFSPDERHILAASWSNGAQLYDAASGEAVGPLLELPPRMSQADISPDGRWIGVCCAADMAQVWDARTFKPAGEPLRHEGSVTWIKFSPDSRKVVTCSWDQTARVRDAQTGRQLLAPLKHSSPVSYVEFSPDGRRIATASRDNTARLWDAETGLPVGEPMRHQSEVRSAVFSPDGRRIATASDDQTARVWDAGTGWPVSVPLPHLALVNDVAWSADGRRLVTSCSDGLARIWELPAAPSPASSWLADIAEAVAGQRLNDGGVLEPISTERLRELRERLAPISSDDAGARWALWFFADRSTRPINPSARMTAAELATLRSTQAPFQLPPLRERISKRDPLTSANCIDLSAHYNAALNDDWHGHQWEGNNLAVLPPGAQTLAGVPFDVRGVVQISGLALRQSVPGFPETVTGIEISRKVRRLHFLQATSWGLDVTTGALIGRYAVRYADGGIQIIPILNGIDTREWQIGSEGAKDLEHAVVAWQGRNALGIAVHLFKSTWENPRPGIAVESIDFISGMTQSAPFLIAVTAE